MSDLKVGRRAPCRADLATEGFPVNNDGQDDAAKRQVGTTLAGGTILRVVEFSPGVQARNHRTDSIDYAIIMAGEIDMEMDGTMIHLKAAMCWCSAARSTTGSQRHRALRDRVCADRRQAGDRRRQGAQTRWVSFWVAHSGSGLGRPGMTEDSG